MKCLVRFVYTYTLVTERNGSRVIQIKFIKFFAWEEKWIAKIIAARMEEMSFLRKGSICVPGMIVFID